MTTLFATARITRSIFGISTKILCGGFMTNYMQKNNKKGTVSVRFLFALCLGIAESFVPIIFESFVDF